MSGCSKAAAEGGPWAGVDGTDAAAVVLPDAEGASGCGAGVLLELAGLLSAISGLHDVAAVGCALVCTCVGGWWSTSVPPTSCLHSRFVDGALFCSFEAAAGAAVVASCWCIGSFSN